MTRRANDSGRDRLSKPAGLLLARPRPVRTSPVSSRFADLGSIKGKRARHSLGVAHVRTSQSALGFSWLRAHSNVSFLALCCDRQSSRHVGSLSFAPVRTSPLSRFAGQVWVRRNVAIGRGDERPNRHHAPTVGLERPVHQSQFGRQTRTTVTIVLAKFTTRVLAILRIDGGTRASTRVAPASHDRTALLRRAGGWQKIRVVLDARHFR